MELLLVWSSPSHEGPPAFAIKLSCPVLLQRATAGSVQRKFPLNSYVHQRTLMDKSSGDTYARKKNNKLSEVSQSWFDSPMNDSVNRNLNYLMGFGSWLGSRNVEFWSWLILFYIYLLGNSVKEWPLKMLLYKAMLVMSNWISLNVKHWMSHSSFQGVFSISLSVSLFYLKTLMNSVPLLKTKMVKIKTV